jgi:hypothetical protein
VSLPPAPPLAAASLPPAAPDDSAVLTPEVHDAAIIKTTSMPVIVRRRRDNAALLPNRAMSPPVPVS